MLRYPGFFPNNRIAPAPFSRAQRCIHHVEPRHQAITEHRHIAINSTALSLLGAAAAVTWNARRSARHD